MTGNRRDDGTRWQTGRPPQLEPVLLLAAAAEEAFAPAHPPFMDHDDQGREDEDRHNRRNDPSERLIHLQRTPKFAGGLAGRNPSVISKLGRRASCFAGIDQPGLEHQHEPQ